MNRPLRARLDIDLEPYARIRANLTVESGRIPGGELIDVNSKELFNALRDLEAGSTDWERVRRGDGESAPPERLVSGFVRRWLSFVSEDAMSLSVVFHVPDGGSRRYRARIRSVARELGAVLTAYGVDGREMTEVEEEHLRPEAFGVRQVVRMILFGPVLLAVFVFTGLGQAFDNRRKG